MTKYAKLIDNAVQYAPKVLRAEGKTYISPNADTLKAHGYYPVVETERPTADEGCVVVSANYALEDDAIVRKWVQEPKPAPTQEEISQMRQSAYVQEADKYSMAWLGYTLKGDTEKAENAKRAYLLARKRIEERLPYAEEPSVQIPIAGDDDLL